MAYFVYRCDCGEEIEDENPSPPLCRACNSLMKRVFTPPMLVVKGGTPRFHRTCHDKPARREQEQGIAEYESEQKTLRAGMRERKKNDEKAFKNYCEGELHHKHGRPDEAATHDPGKKYGGMI